MMRFSCSENDALACYFAIVNTGRIGKKTIISAKYWHRVTGFVGIEAQS